ncbi:odorant receptor 13a-like [Phymastichus coffea]|uniref:odorant receptor 13a-like n=1 Tax=Phymastichus coffea TaxID=108790 RepID=UPI00273CD39B|nr:odorant receptor 13a-like [Phymastichus coffea]
MIGAGYFRALRQRISSIASITDRDDEDRAHSRLVECARLHQRLLHFCSRIDGITRDLFFVQLLCTVYVISLVGIKIVGSDPDRYKFMPFILANIGQLFICQWAPDHLIQESTAISTAVYSVSSAWIRRRVGRLSVLVIARSQRPVQMTAAGVVNLSIENFGSMLTSAASFFTVLRNFNE